MNRLRSTNLLVPALLVFSIVSGCVASDGATKDASNGGAAGEPAAPAVATGDTGSIQGTVTDDSLAPLAGAQVALQQAEMSTVTDQDGGFTFNGIAPGSYNMFAAALGYESAGRRVDVKAGEITPVNFVLSPLPVAEPYQSHLTYRGFFGCSWRVVIATGPCFFPGPDVNPYIYPQQYRAFFYNVLPNWRSLVGELDWTQTSFATGSTLSMTLSYANRTTSHWWSNVEGTPILLQRCDRTEDEWLGCNGGSQLPSGQPKEIPNNGTYTRQFVNTGNARVQGQPVSGFGMAFQQVFTLYVTIFYWEAAPETYTAVPDN